MTAPWLTKLYETNMNMKTRPTIASKSAQGFSLVEILVAMTVGILILLALSAVLVNNSSTRRSGDRNATVQTNARFAIDVLRRDLQQAGYAGSVGYMPNTLDNKELFAGLKNTLVVSNACVGARAGHLEWPIEASNNTTNANLFACVPNSDYVAGTDMLIVRHASQQRVAPADRQPNVAYYYSVFDAPKSRYGVGAATPQAETVSGVAAVNIDTSAIYAVEENVYYIRPWSFSATESPRIPALVRRSLVAGPGMSTGDADLIASGVVNMQLSFGLSTNRSGAAPQFSYQNWSASLVDPAQALNIPNSLESVRISLLLRSLTPEPGYTNSDTYQVGDVAVPAFNDNYRRIVASSTVQVRR